jgi:hypothetical protein
MAYERGQHFVSGSDGENWLIANIDHFIMQWLNTCFLLAAALFRGSSLIRSACGGLVLLDTGRIDCSCNPDAFPASDVHGCTNAAMAGCQRAAL